MGLDAMRPNSELPNWDVQRELGSTASTNANIQPALTYDHLQNLWLVYAFLSASSNQILLQKYDRSGAPNDTPIEVVQDAVGIHNEPDVCALTDGGVVVVWSVDTRVKAVLILKSVFRSLMKQVGQ